MSAGPIAQRDCTFDPCGTCTCSCWLRGMAARNAMSSLEGLPEAQRSASATSLETQRIVHSQGKLGVAEVLRLIDVVEEVVQAAARYRGPALREVPGEPGLQAWREREEVLLGQVVGRVERAGHV